MFWRVLANALHGLLNVFNDILYIFNAHRQPYEVGSNASFT